MTSRLRPLSALAVSRLTASAFVGGVPGLQLVVSPKGTKTWRLFYRLPGDNRRRAMNLGKFPDVSLAEARRRASEELRRSSEGEDPKRSLIQRAERSSLTVREAVEAYLAACEAQNDARTVTAKESALRCHFLSAHGRRPLTSVTKGDLARLLDTLADRPALRRNLHAYLRHFYSWCAERELVDAHPLLLLRAPRPVKPRERVLTDEEIRALWSLDGVMPTIAKLALLTAQRKGSLERARWDGIDLAAAIWTIPADDMKSGKAHLVPLSPAAVAILGAWPRLQGPHVFGVGSQGEKPYNGASNGIESLRRDVGTSDWRLHDLRRTAVTLAQRGGASIDEIRALTQHKVAGIIGVYARHGYEAEKRRVVTLIAAEIENIVKLRQPQDEPLHPPA